MQWIGEPRRCTTLPKRVLHLGDGRGSRTGDVRLPETQRTFDTYVALSHCWLQRDILKTTKNTLGNHSLGIVFQTMPSTFQEAVMICRWLGVRYLWSDSLRIIQDDTADWEEQASEMDLISESAFFTLAAHGYPSILPNPKDYEIAYRGNTGQTKVWVRQFQPTTFCRQKESS